MLKINKDTSNTTYEFTIINDNTGEIVLLGDGETLQEINRFIGELNWVLGGFCYNSIDEKVISFRSGKVRDIVEFEKELLLSSSNRLSAFDKIITAIPEKGMVINKISNFWFNITNDIVDNHLIKEVAENKIRVKKCITIPLEIIVRGTLCGSLYRDYIAGKTDLPDGMKEYDDFKCPMITPTTKSSIGHDEKITLTEILKNNIISEDDLYKIIRISTALFNRGKEVYNKVGIKLLDTKYEFGLFNNEIMLIDEIHTPDSSRLLFENEHYDKEYFRRWLSINKYISIIENGGQVIVPENIKSEIARRYKKVYQLLISDHSSSKIVGEIKRN